MKTAAEYASLVERVFNEALAEEMERLEIDEYVSLPSGALYDIEAIIHQIMEDAKQAFVPMVDTSGIVVIDL